MTQNLDYDTLAEWLGLPPHKPIHCPDVATALAEWLVQEDRIDISELATKLWSNFDMTYEFDEGFGDKLKPGLVV